MKNINTKDMVLASLFSSLMAIGAQIAIPLVSGVDFTLQIFFAMLAGAILGSRLGAISMIVYMLMGLVGLPVFAKGYGGIGIILKPSFGYILGFILCAFIIGYIIERIKNKKIAYIIAPFIGLVVDYVLGVPYLYVILKTSMREAMTPSLALAYGFWPFIFLDLIKAVIVTGIILSVVPRLKKENLIYNK